MVAIIVFEINKNNFDSNINYVIERQCRLLLFNVI